MTSTSQDYIMSQEDTSSPGYDKKKRGAYLCSKCGEPKKGHSCKSGPGGVEIPQQIVSLSPQVKKKRKMQPEMRNLKQKDEIVVEQTGVVLQTLASVMQDERAHSLSQFSIVNSNDPRSKLKTIKPMRDDSLDYRESRFFRKEIAKRCYLAQDSCNSLSEGKEIFIAKAQKQANELLQELDQMKEKFLEPDNVTNTEGTVQGNIEVAKILSQFNDKASSNGFNNGIEYTKGPEQILNFLQIFTEELYAEWPDDKGTGLKYLIEDNLFSLWEQSFYKLQHSVVPSDLVEWANFALIADKQGRLKLKLDAAPELRLLSMRPDIEAFRANPSFKFYKSLLEKVQSPELPALKKVLLDCVGINDPNQLKTRLNILVEEKRFQQLKEEVGTIKSNEFIVEIATQIAHLYPNDIIEKADKEIYESLKEAELELEEAFDIAAGAFSQWRENDFKTMKQLLNKEENEETDEDYPEDHYITFVRKSFVMAPSEIESYNTYLHQYADLEIELENITLEQPFEFIREIRQKENICSRIYKNIVGWLHCAQISYEEISQREAKDPNFVKDPKILPSFDLFVSKLETRIQDHLNQNDGVHLPIVCSEILCVSNWSNVLQNEFFKLVAVFNGIHKRKLKEFEEIHSKQH